LTVIDICAAGSWASPYTSLASPHSFWGMIIFPHGVIYCIWLTVREWNVKDYNYCSLKAGNEVQHLLLI
jgi:hypothetical protein